jgi:cholest-4-en-3-one 26-monooxygenase
MPTAAPEPGIDLFDPGLPRALATAFDDLRARDPVHALGDGVWLLTRHDDVTRILKDRVRCSTDIHAIRGYDERRPFGPGTALERIQQGLLINLPAEQHRRQRGAQTPRYTRHHVEASMTRLVQRLAEELMAELPDEGEVDWVSAVSRVLPARVFAALFGMPEADLPRLLEWTHYDTVTFDVLLSVDLVPADELARGQAAMFAMRDYLDALAQERRRRPGKDLMSFLLEREAHGQLTYEEVLTQAGEALAAGTTTTQTLLAGMVEAFAERPEEWRRLRSTPSLVRPAVEEMLRFVSPVLSMGRVAMEDFELRGRRIRAGDVLQGAVLAANRDPEAFADPHGLDVARSPNPHVAFGGGAHVCLGQHIARLEARVVLERLLRRFGRIELAGDGGRLHPTLMVRTYRTLPVRLAP